MIPVAVRKRLVVAAALVVALSGCGPTNATSNPTSNPSAGPGASTATESPAPTASGEQPSLAPPVGLEHSVYFLVQDSSGTRPNSDTRVSLMFEPQGRVALYAVSATDSMAHHGTWTYGSGSVSLKFTAVDFQPDATFALGLGDESVTMPFQVFSTDPGTSTWRLGRLSLVSEVTAVFDADEADQDVTLTPDQAVGDAFNVAQDRAALGGDLETNVTAGTAPTGVLASIDRSGATEPRWGADFAPAAPAKVTKVTQLANGLKIEFDNAPSISLPLFDWAADPASTASLTANPISADPRVRLDPAKPGVGKDDPEDKTAVLIAPFKTGIFYGQGLGKGSHDPSKGFDWSGYTTKLKKSGYYINPLFDADATLMGILRALGGMSGRAPGFVIFNSHGMSDGSIATGMDLGQVGDTAAVDAAFAAAEAEIKDMRIGDLLTFGGGTEASPKTITKMALKRDGAPTISDYFLAVTPDFWKWLAKKGGNFNRSLVYTASCWTDATPALREAIHARSYMAWSKAVDPILAGAVASYLVDDLARPTHSSEEAFYNIFRVVSMRQQIYDEDLDFKKAIPAALDKGTAFLDHFHGWGWDGTNLVPYGTSGWLDRTMNPGNVWWLVFTARWDKDAAAGAQKLVDCNATYWSKGKPGGIADAFCNAAFPGVAPTADELGYATYLLTGTRLTPYSKAAVPRWTLNDG